MNHFGDKRLVLRDEIDYSGLRGEKKTRNIKNVILLYFSF